MKSDIVYLYVIVSQAYLAQFYPEHEYKATTVIITFADENFIGKGKLVTKVDWKEYVSGKIAEKKTTPPKKFTPSTLLQAMKEIFLPQRQARFHIVGKKNGAVS